jgi:hypothetical protein
MAGEPSSSSEDLDGRPLRARSGYTSPRQMMHIPTSGLPTLLVERSGVQSFVIVGAVDFGRLLLMPRAVFPRVHIWSCWDQR